MTTKDIEGMSPTELSIRQSLYTNANNVRTDFMTLINHKLTVFDSRFTTNVLELAIRSSYIIPWKMTAITAADEFEKAYITLTTPPPSWITQEKLDIIVPQPANIPLNKELVTESNPTVYQHIPEYPVTVCADEYPPSDELVIVMFEGGTLDIRYRTSDGAWYDKYDRYDDSGKRPLKWQLLGDRFTST